MLRAVGDANERQFNGVQVDQRVGRLTFHQTQTLFELPIAKHELAKHQQPDPQMQQDVAALFVENQQAADQQNHTRTESLGDTGTYL